MRLSDDEFDNLFLSFRQSAFRLETLPVYRVEEEDEALDAFLQGVPLPSQPGGGWVELVSKATSAGKTMRRVRVLTEPVQPYFRFELEWAYLYNAEAGEEIGILSCRDPAEIFTSLPFHDFWLFDDSTVVSMHYDASGRYIDAERLPNNASAPFKDARDIAIRDALPLQQYLKVLRRSHPLPLISA